MLHPLRPEKLEAIDQPIYWRRFNGRSLVDPLRPFTKADGYSFRGVVFPNSSRQLVPARGQVEDHVSIAPGSYLIQIKADCDNAFPNDFRFDVVDAGSGRALANNWLRYMTGTGGNRLTNEAARFGPNRGLPFIPPSPWVITDPGQVNIKIVNLATVAQNIALLLVFAEKNP